MAITNKDLPQGASAPEDPTGVAAIDAGDREDDVQGTAVPDGFEEASRVHGDPTFQQSDGGNTGKRTA